LVSFLESHRIGQVITVSLNLVTDHIQIHEVHHLIICGFLLVRRSPKQVYRADIAPLLNTMLAGVMPVISWVDALQARR
jgi:hypothetical protein